jgi:D-beta-D-heptose 7-phosphate kinase/D-beta-D-heptose 1-phosphate adenosyltransferase
MRPVVVIGDSLLDVDLVGRASRLTPDAPAPVLDDLVEHARPGGAALAALLLARGGREVVLVTSWSDDDAGARLSAMAGRALTLHRVPGGGTTPVKRRVRAGGQTLLRLDTGGVSSPHGKLEAHTLAILREAAAILVSDYGRGLAALEQVRRAVSTYRTGPVVWDPHPRGPAAVPGARLVTPNAAEVTALTGVHEPAAAGHALADRWSADSVAVTLGDEGALLSTRGEVPLFLPAPQVVATDTCGAGDSFAAAAALRLAEGALPSEAVADAVVSAAEFVAAGAAGSIDLARGEPDLVVPARRRECALVATGGCFDLLHAGHVASLEAARRLGDRLVVCLNSDTSVRRLKGPDRPLVPQADRARVLSALECVDEVVVFDEDTPVEVLRRVRPDIWAKGGDYDASSMPETEVLSEWGGRAVVLPYLNGRSTTDMVRTVRAGERRNA